MNTTKILLSAILVLAGAFPARAGVVVSAAVQTGWTLPFPDISGELLIKIQAGLAQQGPQLLSQLPALGAVSRLSPDSPIDRQIAAKLISAAPIFGPQKDVPAQRAWFQSLDQSIAVARPRIEEVVAARAKELADAAEYGELTRADLAQSLRELRRFGVFGWPAVSKSIQDVSRLSQSMPAKEVLSSAQRSADALAKDAAAEDGLPDPSAVRAEQGDGSRRRNLLSPSPAKKVPGSRPFLFAQWEKELMQKLPDSVDVDNETLRRELQAMLDELWALDKGWYEKTLRKLLVLPKDSKNWRLLAYGQRSNGVTRAVDKAAILFEPWEVRRWIYEPSYNVLTADDVVEYAERIADLGYGSYPTAGDGYLDWYAIYNGLEYVRGEYSNRATDSTISAPAVVEEGLADLLIRGRLARLFKDGGRLVPHASILSWVTKVIHDRKGFDEAFRGKLDAMLRRGYEGMPPRD